MALDFTTPLIFARLILAICEGYALLSFVLLFVMRRVDPKEKPHWTGRMRTLALWYLLVPPVLYGLQFIVSALCIYVLGLLLMMISLHILREWFIIAFMSIRLGVGMQPLIVPMGSVSSIG